MNKVKIVKLITSAYFAFALVVSFMHLIHAGKLTGLGWEAYSVPFMIDGIAILGLIMRGNEFSAETQRWGLITQVTAGTMSLIGNVYAAEGNPGKMGYGVAVVVLFLAAEFLSHKIKGAAEVAAAKAAEEAEAAAQAKRDKANAAARARRAAKKAPVRKLKAV